MNDIILHKQRYKLFAYEKKMAVKEVQSILHPEYIREENDCIKAYGCKRIENASRLVFYSSYENEGTETTTTQAIRESSTRKKQNTRYYAHGIHDYKGKFNPQIVKALLNIFDIQPGQRVLDPFCGSGTSLFEIQLMGGVPYGVDINPMAVFIASTKTSVGNEVEACVNFNIDAFMTSVQDCRVDISGKTERMVYLRSWFREDYLRCLEAIRITAGNEKNESLRKLILLCASNIIREYSEQEPSDLRIRRRKSAYPEESLFHRFSAEFTAIQVKIAKMLEDNVGNVPKATIYNDSVVNIGGYKEYKNYFDFAVTSPPYATALPYIDTQRLSLVWLGLARPSEIIMLESSLIGSRELKRKSVAAELLTDLKTNANKISSASHYICMDLQNKLVPSDGFRKQNVPILLYRYISEMRAMFSSVYTVLKTGAYYCLVVGHNKTTIGGVTTYIDTPTLLCNEAAEQGFVVSEVLPLETYQRYGIHAQNAITNESLIVLQKQE